MGYLGFKPAEQAVQIGSDTILSSHIDDGVIVNADINASASIAVSKTALSAGAGLTLSTNSLSVDADQSGQITSVGTLTGLTTSGNLIINHDGTNSLRIGASADLQFYHNGTDSVISNGQGGSNNGKLFLWNFGSGNTVLGSNDVESIVCDGANSIFRGSTTTSGNATFSGNVSLDNSGSLTRMTIENNTESNILFTLGGASKGQLYADSNGISIRSESSVPLLFKTNGNTTALTLGTDQSATFTGNILGNGRLQCAVSLDATFAHELFNSHSTGHGLKIRGGSTGSHYSLYVADYNQSNALFYVMGNGDANFSGAITQGGNGFNLTGTVGRLKISGTSGGDNYMYVGNYNDNGWGYIESFDNANGLYFNAPKYRFDAGNLCPYTDSENSLGEPGLLFTTVYADTGTINTSDKRRKDNIKTSSLGLDFLNQLNPVQYKFKDYDYVKKGRPHERDKDVTVTKTHKRTHYGLIAQEVEKVLTDNGLTTVDFAPIIYDEESDRYGMRYSEYVGILIKAVQELSAKVKSLESA